MAAYVPVYTNDLLILTPSVNINLVSNAPAHLVSNASAHLLSNASAHLFCGLCVACWQKTLLLEKKTLREDESQDGLVSM